MSWQHAETLNWCEPLDMARAHADEDMALLYSGVAERFTGQHSYLLLTPIETIEGDDWAQLPPLPAEGDALPLWVGYLGYEMGDAGGQRSEVRGQGSGICLPHFRFTRYATLYVFEHTARVVTRFYAVEREQGHKAGSASPLAGEATRLSERSELSRCGEGAIRLTEPHLHARSSQPSTQGEGLPRGASPLHSNLSHEAYARIVAETIEQIHAGAFYQANITRKFWGTLSPNSKGTQYILCPQRQPKGDTIYIVSPLSLFTALCEASPAPYAAYIRHGDTTIASSSPECFLRVEPSGRMTTRPIKGSARRSADEAEDKAIRESLTTSAKNHAENLMIVDLMRNDLAQVAEPTSVAVLEQSALYSYRTIHHLISTVRGQKRGGASVYDAVRACFPAGSMTGAPKRAAMRWCTAREGMARGVYSGAIGWFGPGDTCDLSVVIRTLIVQGNRFEFQVGGGIVADSTPEDEWRETLAKARGLCAALGIDEATLAAL